MHRSKQQRYSITSSASCYRCNGTSRPSAFAVFMLMTNSNSTFRRCMSFYTALVVNRRTDLPHHQRATERLRTSLGNPEMF
jgi:hypothetical protein